MKLFAATRDDPSACLTLRRTDSFSQGRRTGPGNDSWLFTIK